ncbi:hypothetical protein, partial [Microbacterium murale]|uniref:hypothetical protein n=1 Tax=Microbacterium murale TaxID=1081040 RepID=UPI001E659891
LDVYLRTDAPGRPTPSSEKTPQMPFFEIRPVEAQQFTGRESIDGCWVGEALSTACQLSE